MGTGRVAEMVDPHCAHIANVQQAARTTSAESTRRHWQSLRSGIIKIFSGPVYIETVYIVSVLFSAVCILHVLSIVFAIIMSK